MLAPPGWAQDSSDGDETASNLEALIEEVFVYGTKRSSAESPQGVAAQIAAFGSRQLEARQVINIEDLSMTTPNVSLDGVGSSPGVANFAIRGQGINSSIPSIDPTVGVFLNGVYLGVTYGVITDLYDMESVEIHKGPQGVLFGRNVTGGAVLLRTARPDGDFGFKAKIGAETGLQKTFAASIQGGLNDKVAARLSIQFKDDDGYFKNATLGRDTGKEETLVVRPTIVFSPSESFETTVIWEHGNMEGDGATAQESAGGVPVRPFDTVGTVVDNPGFIDMNWDQVTVESRLNLGEGSITNIFGYRDLFSSAGVDVDSTPLELFDATLTSTQDQISNELRYNGQLTDTWELTAGLFYYQADLVYEENRSLVFGGTRIGGGGAQDHETVGVFANNYVDLSDVVTLQAGLRYSSEKKNVLIHPLGTCTYELDCGAGNTAADKWTNWSPKVGLRWRSGEDLMLYGHWARSYRAGGYNFRSPLLEPKAFNPERIDSFEAGMKTAFMDGRVRVNAAVFYSKINDMQREVSLADPSIGVFQDVTNTASAEIKGMEFDTTLHLIDNFAIAASVGYLDGDYTEMFADLSGDGMIDQTDLNLELPRLAKWTVNIGLTYEVELEIGIITARADYAHRSRSPYTARNHGFFNSYNQINAGLAFEPREGNWTLSLYGKNLSNDPVLGGLNVLPFGDFGGSYFAPLKKGRRWGAEVRVEF